MNFAIPLWAKIAGPIIALALIIGALLAWGNSKYHAGERAGIAATDKKWEAAAAQLKADAAKSATKADDAAANRLEVFVEQQEAEQAKIDEAVKEGRSPLDALFN